MIIKKKKQLSSNRNRGNFLNLTKNFHRKLTANTILNGEKYWEQGKYLPCQHSIQHHTGTLSYGNLKKKCIVWERRNKTTFVLRSHDILFRNPQRINKKNSWN